MIIYIETNFVLELALMQEEHASCDDLLQLAVESVIDLFLPAFSVGEAYEAWTRQSRKRRALHDQLLAEVMQLGRSRPYIQAPNEFRELTGLLLRVGEEEKRRLDSALDRILSVARIIPIDRVVLQDAIGYQRSRSLTPQDSIVYASILRHAASQHSDPKCFVTRNKSDFLTPDIEDDLKPFDCKMLVSYCDALGFARSQRYP